MFWLTCVRAQDSTVEIFAGTGQSQLTRSINAHDFYSNLNNRNYSEFGLKYHFKPKDAVFTVSSGLNYITREYNTRKLDYFRIPLGINFSNNHKLYFDLGVGLYGSCFLLESRTVPTNYPSETHSRFQLGATGNVGFGVKITKQHQVGINYIYSRDLSKMYDEESESAGGVKSLDPVYGQDLAFRIYYRYTLKKSAKVTE